MVVRAGLHHGTQGTAVSPSESTVALTAGVRRPGWAEPTFGNLDFQLGWSEPP